MNTLKLSVGFSIFPKNIHPNSSENQPLASVCRWGMNKENNRKR
ncbi:MAG: hypothetical protein SOZ07_04935 [Prevotella sp.]|nr:hypothetical protein [Prevotellaceae bacterium]MDY3935987.1 hypothetical protein [Prevotella sp.]